MPQRQGGTWCISTERRSVKLGYRNWGRERYKIREEENRRGSARVGTWSLHRTLGFLLNGELIMDLLFPKKVWALYRERNLKGEVWERLQWTVAMETERNGQNGEKVCKWNQKMRWWAEGVRWGKERNQAWLPAAGQMPDAMRWGWRGWGMAARGTRVQDAFLRRGMNLANWSRWGLKVLLPYAQKCPKKLDVVQLVALTHAPPLNRSPSCSRLFLYVSVSYLPSQGPCPGGLPFPSFLSLAASNLHFCGHHCLWCQSLLHSASFYFLDPQGSCPPPSAFFSSFCTLAQGWNNVKYPKLPKGYRIFASFLSVPY